MKKQNAKFFCENCGSEVPQNARMCRHCGRFFSSVRCPVCGTTGSNEKFVNGCPNCGYAVGKGKIIPPPAKENHAVPRKTKKDFISAIDSRSPYFSAKKKKGQADGALPLWSFFLITSVFAILIFGAMKYLEII